MKEDETNTCRTTGNSISQLKYTRAVASGAAIQCGFDKLVTGEGNVGTVQIELYNNSFIFSEPVQINTVGKCLNPQKPDPGC